MNYNERKQRLIAIFQDTQEWYRSEKTLVKSIERTKRHTKLYREGEAPKVPVPRYQSTQITVTQRRTLEAAAHWKREKPERTVCVHNFASATNPGGGVTQGSSAQEECLCRCSTLYPCLKSEELYSGYYQFHRARQDSRYTDACIYTPKVTVIKTDTSFPERMAKQEWYDVDVLTCAAPNLRPKPYNAMNPGSGNAKKVSDQELLALHRQRARHLLSVAAFYQVDVLVLGAFGCGAFCNPPEIVVRAYRETLPEFQGQFEAVEYAVYCPPKDRRNYDAFQTLLSPR